MPMETIASIDRWFKEAHGDHPHKKLTVQLGVHFEEVGEMIQAIESGNPTAEVLLKEAEQAMQRLSAFLKENSKEVVIYAKERSLVLDSLCDQIVTAVGVAHDLGMDLPRGLQEVNRSNFSKFVNNKPVFDENGKIKKGPNYTPPNLTGYV